MKFKSLQSNFVKPGKVVYISVRPKRLEPVIELEEIEAIAEKGLDGDRYKGIGGARQVTLIQAEHLRAISSFLSKEITADIVRRNIVVEGINLLALRGKHFKIGAATLEYSGECHPCSRMEESLGAGGYNAMRGHGGITAKVIQSGLIKLEDLVIALP
jgi:MOSC domain-containing protein YiiM